MWARLWNINRK